MSHPERKEKVSEIQGTFCVMFLLSLLSEKDQVLFKNHQK